MERCDCYNTRVKEYGSFIDICGVCLSTKESKRCNCFGIKSNCDFYPEKRKAAEKKMNTAEMWLKAQEDGKTYICNSVLYSKKTGFISATSLDPWPISVFDSIDTLMESQWSLHQVEIMTKAEAEKKYGIKIVS